MNPRSAHCLVIGLVLALALSLSGLAAAAQAADTDGLDLTIEVLGKDERIDERIVNRIAIPGVPLGQPGVDRNALSGPEATLPPALQQPLGAVEQLTREALDLLRPRTQPAE